MSTTHGLKIIKTMLIKTLDIKASFQKSLKVARDGLQLKFRSRRRLRAAPQAAVASSCDSGRGVNTALLQFVRRETAG